MKRLRSERKERAEAKRVAWAKEDARPWLKHVGEQKWWVFRKEHEMTSSLGRGMVGRVVCATLLFVDGEGKGHFETAEGDVSSEGATERAGGVDMTGMRAKGTFEAWFADVIGTAVPGDKEAFSDVAPGSILAPTYGRKQAERDLAALLTKA